MATPQALRSVLTSAAKYLRRRESFHRRGQASRWDAARSRMAGRSGRADAAYVIAGSREKFGVIVRARKSVAIGLARSGDGGRRGDRIGPISCNALGLKMAHRGSDAMSDMSPKCAA